MSIENEGDLARRIGLKVKEPRKGVELTLKQLSETTGLSSPLLSRIENGSVMPSIPTLQMIANAFRTEVGYFFTNENDRKYVRTKQGKRRIIYSPRGTEGKVSYEIELLAEGMKSPFIEPVVATLVGREEEMSQVSHGGQELIYGLEGKTMLLLEKERITIGKGDSVYFDGSIPHKAISLSKKAAKVLSVHISPGGKVIPLIYEIDPLTHEESYLLADQQRHILLARYQRMYGRYHS